MARTQRLVAAVLTAAAAAALMSGCAAVREVLATVQEDRPVPTLEPAAAPYEKIYSGGSRPDGLTDEAWEQKATRRIMAAAVVDRIPVYSVEAAEDSDGLTVTIKGDPEDTQLLADIEKGVVPVALRWAPLVTIVVDPSVCSVLGEVRPDTPLCDALESRLG